MTRRRAPGAVARERARRAIVVAFLIVVLGGAVAFAWTSRTTNPGNQVGALALQDPSGLTVDDRGGRATNCSDVELAWSAAPAPATTYAIEVRTGSEPWALLVADTAGATSWNDTTRYERVEVTYRVRSRLAGSDGALTNWMSPGIERSVLCSPVGDVADLAAEPGCGARLSWTAATNAARYDVRASADGGASWATLATDHEQTSYDVGDVEFPGGQPVQFQVRPENADSQPGNWSNAAQVNAWGFHATSVVIGGDGDNLLEAGETIRLTFNRAADTATPSGAGAVDIAIRRSNPRGMFLAASRDRLDDTGIGQLPASTAFVTNANDGVFAGTAHWDAAGTTWTWTKGPGAVRFSARPQWTGEFVAGTSRRDPAPVRCASGTHRLADSSVVITGTF